jgi:hypothetical protein
MDIDPEQGDKGQRSFPSDATKSWAVFNKMSKMVCPFLRNERASVLEEGSRLMVVRELSTLIMILPASDLIRPLSDIVKGISCIQLSSYKIYSIIISILLSTKYQEYRSWVHRNDNQHCRFGVTHSWQAASKNGGYFLGIKNTGLGGRQF